MLKLVKRGLINRQIIKIVDIKLISKRVKVELKEVGKYN